MQRLALPRAIFVFHPLFTCYSTCGSALSSAFVIKGTASRTENTQGLIRDKQSGQCFCTGISKF